MNTYRVGIIDDDDSMVFLLQGQRDNQIFTLGTEEYKFEIIPIEIVEDINVLLKEVSGENLDALLIDYRINDRFNISYQGIDLIEHIEKTRPFYPAFLLTGYSDQAEQSVIDVNKIYEKKEFFSNEKCMRINQKIVRQIESYKKRIELAEERLCELRKRELTEREEEEVIRLEHIVEGSIFGGPSLSPILKHNSFSKDLSNLIMITENLLAEIKK